MTLVFCCWLFMDSHRWPHIYCSHWPKPWSTSVVTGCLISNVPLTFESFPCTSTPQLIDPCFILNDPGLLLLIVYRSTSQNPDLLLPLTQFLVFCFRHKSSAIKSSSYFRNFSLYLHSTIDRPHNQSSITLVFCYWLSIDFRHWTHICHSLPLNRYLVCCCCHWSSAIKSSSDFRIFALQLLPTTYRPLINPQLSWSFAADRLLIHIYDPKSISTTNPVLGMLLLSLVFRY